MRTDYSLSSTSRSGRPRQPIEIMMAPMIDVIFLLLVFFLTSSSFRKPEKMLPSGMAQIAETTGQSDVPPEISDDKMDQIIIKATYENGLTTWALNSVRPLDLAQLHSRLDSLGKLQRDVPVIIDPDGSVPIGEVISAYDSARSVGLTRVHLATRKRTEITP